MIVTHFVITGTIYTHYLKRQVPPCTSGCTAGNGSYLKYKTNYVLDWHLYVIPRGPSSK